MKMFFDPLNAGAKVMVRFTVALLPLKDAEVLLTAHWGF